MTTRHPTPISSVQIQSLREELREQLEQRGRHLDGLRRQQRDSSGADDTWQELSVAIVVAERAVAELSHALERLAEGTYGRCADCAGVIPFERLKIRPLARTCIDCQRRHEAA
ncbi:TraR/DksA C4-type zinc finger protein [Herbidospora sp. NBRC 101105]|uniref:TraR/DksA family transcriptional regulator n=1 Tax=Herbidospora sp. NBRC 101105 TaxID=3032195 RepID=UPI0024A517FE|nr:TraR/DksA C4-type zinc finger protein [Herbidospora sp. NBRC 101105]GLX93790.1 RNA polymerase-binding transcription factor DksA [Herbidospora sp. NBRC 101105]